MTSMKTVLLGSAAAIIATGAAQAADLPVKKAAAAVQYVEVCPAFGKGFYKLPGSDICIRHFGSLKVNFALQGNKRNVGDDGVLVVNEDLTNNAGWEYSIRPGWDFRSPTEFGTLRTVVQLRSDRENGNYAGPGPAGTGSDSFSIHRGYIEWAGFLIGRAGSQYTYFDQDDVVNALGGDAKVTSTQLTYVWALGGGLQATIGIEDNSAWSNGVVDISAGVAGSVSGTGPQRMYDVVASLSTEQSWGTAKLSGIIHQITSNNGSTSLTTSFDETEIGWGVQGGISFNLPTIGAGDRLLLQAAYGDGVIAAGGVQAGGRGTLTTFAESGQYLDGLMYSVPDAYAVSDGTATGWDLEKVKAWSILGSFRHYWSPMWRTNIVASYQAVDVPAAATTGTLAGGSRGDATSWDIGANLIWGKSRQTVEIGVEVLYAQTDIDLPAGTTAASLPGGNTDISPESWLFAAFIQRAW